MWIAYLEKTQIFTRTFCTGLKGFKQVKVERKTMIKYKKTLTFTFRIGFSSLRLSLQVGPTHLFCDSGDKSQKNIFVPQGFIMPLHCSISSLQKNSFLL